MSTRRRAREIVLQLLFQDDLNPDLKPEVAERFLIKRLNGNRPLIDFARKLFQGVIKQRKELDSVLSDHATNWSVRRMAAIDRNILRLGACEILYTETPGRVIINEAVEIAKRYGDRQSGQFVNGILDRVLRTRVANESTAEAAAATSDA